MWLLYLALIWLVLFSYLLYTIVYVNCKYTQHVIDLPEQWKPFQRKDRQKWKILEMFICGYFLLPLRICILFGTLTNAAIWFYILGVIKYPNHNRVYPKWKADLVSSIARYSGFFLTIGGGFNFGGKIVRSKSFQDFDPSYKVPENITDFKNKPPITISNHVSWSDAFVLLTTRYSPSFFSKKAVESIPLYGTTNTAVQSIYVDRDDKTNKNFALDAINERSQFIKEGKPLPPIHIFPEGTTTSGSHLISFKKGAFEPKLPIGVVCVKYDDCNFHPSIDIDETNSVFLQLCQFSNKLTVYDLGIYYPQGNIDFQNNEDDWKLYATKVKNIMIKCLGVQNSEAGFRDYKEYEKIRKKTYGKNAYKYTKTD